MSAPLVTVAIANCNGGAYLEDAIRTALDQDLHEIEVLVIDDASDDDSPSAAARAARSDPRVRVERLPWRRGAGGARNRALDLARGTWFAVLDSDDLMHPARLTRLVERARADNAEIVADDLLVFDDAVPAKVSRFLGRRRAKTPTWVTAEDFLQETHLLSRGPDLRHLKPLIHLESWRGTGIRYGEALRIGEDHDLLLRLLLAGLRCRLEPFLGYFYRQRAAPVSHPWSGEDICEMERAAASARAALTGPPAPLVRAMDRRDASLRTARVFTRSINALKAGRVGDWAGILLRRPSAAALYHAPLAAAAGRLAARIAPARAGPAGSGADVWFITRQRVVGRTNGSSTYLLDLAEAVRGAGLTPHLLQPSPRVLGRWPVLRLRAEMRVFGSIECRAVVRLGSLIFARDPKVYLAAARGGAARAFAWLGLSAGWLNARPAPYAPAAPLTTEDRLYVARRIRGRAGVLIADYAWQTEALAYALSPRARTAVIMHDLFYRRAQLFPDQVGGDPVTALDRESEIGLLARADTIIAIQKTEAAAVAKRLSWRSVLVVPMTARPAAAPQPGDAGKVLFVASNTAPNLLGLTWMLERVWPRVRSALPHLELIVAGSVCRGLPPPMGGVRYLGFVDRLDRLYAEAGLVVSPLTAGSGLKIKLIEALAHGKACVATSVTLQGVEDEVGHAVAVADPPEAFAAAMVRLLSDRAARVQLGAAGLEAVRTSFSADQRHAEFVRWLSGRVPAKQDRPLREAVAAASEAQLTES